MPDIHMFYKLFQKEGISLLQCLPEKNQGYFFTDHILSVSFVWCISFACNGRHTNTKQHGNKMFLFQGTRDDKIVMVHKPLFESAEEVLVDLQDLKSWRQSKAQAHALVEGTKLKDQLFQHSSVVQDELERAAVSHALLSACMANSYDHELELAFAQHPTGVWTLKSFKAKALKLLPCGNVSKLKGDIPTNKIVLKAGSSKFVVTPYPKVFAQFWSVKTTSDSEEATVQRGELTVENVKIPYFFNPKNLAKGIQLLVADETASLGPEKKKRKAA